jgi:hypothetical protein
MGQRRLKNVACVLEWGPKPALIARTPSQLAGPKLTEEQEASLKKAFSMFDSENVGKVRLTQLKTVMRTVGEDLSDVELANITALLDKDKTGLFLLVIACVSLILPPSNSSCHFCECRCHRLRRLPSVHVRALPTR